MSNPSRRKTTVRLVPTIYQEIEKTKCRPRPRLATGDGSEPRRGLGTPTISSMKGPKGPSRNHEQGALFQRQLQRTPIGKRGRRLLPPTSGGKRDTVKKRRKGTQEEKSGEDMAGGRGERKNRGSGRGISGKNDRGPPMPTRLRWEKPLSQKTPTSNDSIRKRKTSNKPTIDANRGCAKSGVCCGRKELSIAGPMQEGEGS